MKAPAFYIRFTRSQQRGILAMLALILLAQAGWYVLSAKEAPSKAESQEEAKWLALQPRIDSLKAAQHTQEKKIFPFNPNFISDYKGYTIGLTTQQIDKLHAFRNSGRFVNSAADFKAVTGVHDTLLRKIAPYFKFPDWVLKKQQQRQSTAVASAAGGGTQKEHPAFKKEEKKIVPKDINEAVEEDLVQVYGIGPAFAKKILRRRSELGAYVSMEQMEEFPDFSPEAVAGLQKYFKVGGNPSIEKINVNNASLSRLSAFPYFNKTLARAIITRRSMNGKLSNLDELLKINQFPVDKHKIIALYLEF